MNPQSRIRVFVPLLIGAITGVLGGSVCSLLAGAVWIRGSLLEALSIAVGHPAALRLEVGLLCGIVTALIVVLCGGRILGVVIRSTLCGAIGVALTAPIIGTTRSAPFLVTTILPFIVATFVVTIDLQFGLFQRLAKQIR